MRALIIGADGFVGYYLIEELNKHIGIEIFATKLPNALLNPNLSLDSSHVFNLDITEYNHAFEVIKKVKPDFIYHLAAQSSASLAWKLPQMTIEINVIGTLNILEVIREISFEGRMLFIGSGEEYGRFSPDKLPLHEDNELNPTNIYAVSKMTAERFCALYYKAYNLDIVMVRSFNHIGVFQNESFVVADFCKQIAEIEKGLRLPIITVGNLNAVRDFTDVRDVVVAYVSIIEKGFSGQAYNVGGGQVCSIQVILATLLKMTEIPIKIETDKKKFRPIDTPEIYADISKLEHDTGFSHRYELDETLAEILDYWRKKVTSSETDKGTF